MSSSWEDWTTQLDECRGMLCYEAAVNRSSSSYTESSRLRCYVLCITAIRDHGIVMAARNGILCPSSQTTFQGTIVKAQLKWLRAQGRSASHVNNKELNQKFYGEVSWVHWWQLIACLNIRITCLRNQYVLRYRSFWSLALSSLPVFIHEKSTFIDEWLE